MGFPQIIELATLTPDQGSNIEDGDGDGIRAVSSAGDVNGDGIDDLIVGLPSTDGQSGQAYVIFGRTGGFPDLDVSTLAPDQGFAIEGDIDLGYLGFFVSGAGDVNGDGFDDVIVGSYRMGEAWVVFGHDGPFEPVSRDGLAVGQGFVIDGIEPGSFARLRVSDAGDVNGDGFDDVILGWAYADAGWNRQSSGEAYVVFGHADGFSNVDVSALSPGQGFVIAGAVDNGRAGVSVSSAGDVNGDGFDDVIVGAHGAEDAYVVLGHAGPFSTIDLGELTAGQGYVAYSGDGNTGWSVSGAGDFNGDGLSDLIVGSPEAGDYAGEAHVILSGVGSFAIAGSTASANLGWSVSGAGDVNGDGFDDVILSIRNHVYSSNVETSKAYVIFGHAGTLGFADIDVSNLLPAQGFEIHGEPGSFSGNWQVSAAGDVNGDGLDDLIIGVPYGDGTSYADGDAYVIYGTSTFTVSLSGTEGDDALGGGPDDDRLLGLGGNDLLSGYGGDDTLNGGAGDDILTGGAGADALDGGEGIDTLSYAGSSAGVEIRLFDNTAFDGDAAGDAIAGIENVSGSEFGDTFVGDVAANVLKGFGGNNALDGGAGDDVLDGGLGRDVLRGGLGNDQFVVNGQDDAVIELAGQGSDTVFASASYALAADTEIEVLRTTSTAGTAAINLTGNDFSQTIHGNNGANTLYGGLGDDLFYGYGGNDTYSVNGQSDQVFETIGQGTDTIFTSASYALAANAEIEVLRTTSTAGTAAIDLTGNDFSQTIHGNNGVNTLYGGLGDDVLYGYGGNDTYSVNGPSDLVIESVGMGTDVVFTSASYQLATGSEVEVLRTTSQGGTAAINLVGNGFSQALYGNAGANTLHGGSGGDDLLYGFGGNDSYVVNGQSDQVFEGAGQGSDRVYASAHYQLAVNAEIEMLATVNNSDTTAINLVGNNIAQTIVGNAGANTIDGRGGADTLYGLGGADWFAFRTPLGANNIDRVMDYSVADDQIYLDRWVFAGLATGALAAGAFNTGAAATQADDRIIYNSATGALLFDTDGNGAGVAVQFATLSAGLAMTAAEFVVI